MAIIKYKNLDHLHPDDVECFYKRYLTEKATELVKDFNLEPNLANRLFTLIPKEQSSAWCNNPNCEGRDELITDRIRKSVFGKQEVRRWATCSSCGHKQLLSNDLSETISNADDCTCEYCIQFTQEAAKVQCNKALEIIVKDFTVERRFIPFSEVTEIYSLASVAALMAMIFARWNDGDGPFISPFNDKGIPVFPEMHIMPAQLGRSANDRLLAIDLTSINPENFIIKDNRVTSYHLLKLRSFPNFVDIERNELDVKQTYQWLTRKFSEGYWYVNWDNQLLDVWIDIGVAECLEYVRIKCNEYNFTSTCETKIEEIIRDLLNKYSVAECFYFISVAYMNAAAFFQSNKAQSKSHAGNTVPGKILSLASTGIAKTFHRPKDAPRSAYSIMLFDVMLNTNNDAGFYLCPGKSSQDLLNKTQIHWPEAENNDEFDENGASEINISGSGGLIDSIINHINAPVRISTDPVNMQLAHLTVIAEVLGLQDAAQLLRVELMSKEDLAYFNEIWADNVYLTNIVSEE